MTQGGHCGAKPRRPKRVRREMPDGDLTQRTEACAKIAHYRAGLLPRSEVTTFRVSITSGTLSPTPAFLHPAPAAVLHPVPPVPVARSNGLQREPATGHETGLATPTPAATPPGISHCHPTSFPCWPAAAPLGLNAGGSLKGDAPTWKVSNAVGLGLRPWTKPTIVDEALAPGVAVLRDRRAQS